MTLFQSRANGRTPNSGNTSTIPSRPLPPPPSRLSPGTMAMHVNSTPSRPRANTPTPKACSVPSACPCRGVAWQRRPLQGSAPSPGPVRRVPNPVSPSWRRRREVLPSPPHACPSSPTTAAPAACSPLLFHAGGERATTAVGHAGWFRAVRSGCPMDRSQIGGPVVHLERRRRGSRRTRTCYRSFRSRDEYIRIWYQAYDSTWYVPGIIYQVCTNQAYVTISHELLKVRQVCAPFGFQWNVDRAVCLLVVSATSRNDSNGRRAVSVCTYSCQ